MYNILIANMLYIKYRSQTISQIDNPEIREKITSLLSQTDIPHAFLLSGPKGTGKTSIARIIAKSVNCTKKAKNSVDPCNKCSSCNLITRGNNPDVFELDAASNRRIDDIRELIATIHFSPAASKYKVYIIDEVHMLTTESFNAILKTLEEPPQHVLFILATTETEKLPKTIISRCVHVRFPKATKILITNMIHRILKSEKKSLPDDVISYVSSHCENSFRDATKILEEILETKITSLSQVKQMMGINTDTISFLNAILKKDQVQVFAIIEDFSSNGGNFSLFIQECLEELQNEFLLHKKVIDGSFNYTFTLPQVILLMKNFSEAYRNLKFTPIDSLPLEIAVIDYFSKIE